ncbi:MAG: glutamine ABC transporter substrate-binding protein, partial [Proteiniphilum sp.]|nr:glutamine ABC transporter substrate-binding protein [Proteiniphilum sp.]
MKFKKRRNLYLFLLIVAVGTMILLRYMRSGDADRILLPRDYKEITASGELNVVTDYNSIGYFVSGDTARGFQLEMMEALENEWGVKVNL